MENLDILEKLGKIAGIAGIAVGAIVLIFGGIIQKNIFPGMTKEQGFRVIRMMIVAASVLAVLGIGAWVYTEFQKNKTEKAASLIQKRIVGTVHTQAGYGIPSVEVSIARSPGMKDRSDSDGKFNLAVEGIGKKYLDLVFNHSEYDVVRKKVTVDFDNADLDEVSIGEVIMINSYPPEDPPNKKGNSETDRNSNQTENNTTKPNTGSDKPNQSSSRTANITVMYNDEGTGCNLDIQINIGGMVYTPQSNPVDLLDVPRGFQQYTISGIGTCPGGGSCQISGPINGQLKIEDGGMYYLVFDPAFTCIATLLSEEDYNILMDAVY